MRLSVEPRRAVATPGTPTTLGVVVTNGSDVISGYVLRVLGADPSWVEIEDPSPRLFPGESVSGTTIGRDNRSWLIAVGAYQVEIELGDNMLVMLNDDRPGMIGAVGNLLGSEDVNIANMNVSRNERGEAAAMVLSVDNELDGRVLDLLREVDGVRSVRFVAL